jgi:hypothetical protein
MSSQERNRLAESWLQVQRHFWAFISLDQLCENEPEEAWSVIQLLIDLSDTDDLLGDVGAGPLEDLISNHAPRFVDRIEESARNSPAFKKALSRVWLSEGESPVSRRLLALGCDVIRTG